MGVMAQVKQARLDFSMGALMICTIAASCVAPGTYAPYGVQGPAPAHEAASRGVAGRNELCRHGERLAPEWHAELTQRWNRVAMVQAAGQSQPTMSAALACTTAHGFLQNCPAWDDRAPAWQVETCAIALREDLATARARADAYLSGNGDSKAPRPWLLGVLASDIWQTPGTPGNVLTSRARFASLRPTAAEHIALLDQTRVLVEDAEAIADATYLVDNTTSSCESLALLEKHALHQNRYAAAILSRAVATRRLAVLAQLRKTLDTLLSKRDAREASPDLETLRTDAEWARALAAAAACHDPGIARAAEELAVRIEQDIAAEDARRASRVRTEQASPAEEAVPVSPAPPRKRAVERRAPEPDWGDGGGYCCKVCSRGKACGDSCIARDKVCRKGPGCACDG